MSLLLQIWPMQSGWNSWEDCLYSTLALWHYHIATQNRQCHKSDSKLTWSFLPSRQHHVHDSIFSLLEPYYCGKLHTLTKVMPKHWNRNTISHGLAATKPHFCSENIYTWTFSAAIVINMSWNQGHIPKGFQSRCMSKNCDGNIFGEIRKSLRLSF